MLEARELIDRLTVALHERLVYLPPGKPVRCVLESSGGALDGVELKAGPTKIGKHAGLERVLDGEEVGTPAP